MARVNPHDSPFTIAEQWYRLHLAEEVYKAHPTTAAYLRASARECLSVIRPYLLVVVRGGLIGFDEHEDLMSLGLLDGGCNLTEAGAAIRRFVMQQQQEAANGNLDSRG